MSQCYWGSEACRNGHIADCPAACGRDPWAEEKTDAAVAPVLSRLASIKDHSWRYLGDSSWACRSCSASVRDTENWSTMCPGAVQS